jgi:hypothetical protein
MYDDRQNIDPVCVIACQALKDVADRSFLAICSGRDRIAGVAQRKVRSIRRCEGSRRIRKGLRGASLRLPRC